jgi:di/tricarboxylate transporter
LIRESGTIVPLIPPWRHARLNCKKNKPAVSGEANSVLFAGLIYKVESGLRTDEVFNRPVSGLKTRRGIMSLEIGFLFAVLIVMVYLFLTEKLPIDLTAFLGLVFIVLTGYVGPKEAFSGFSSTAVITMLSIFILSGALDQTGLADMVGRRVHAMIGAREVPLIIMIMLVAGLLSAFANNIAATAVLMPAVASIAHRSGLSPSRFFMPLSFGAILGGTTTMVGTPPNILAAEMLRDRGMEPFSLFSFTPMGLNSCIVLT